MSICTTKLTPPVIVEAVDDVLGAYPYHLYQHAFSISNFRQQLIDYALSRCPAEGTAINASQPSLSSHLSSPPSSDVRQEIAGLVCEGILDLFPYQQPVHHCNAETLSVECPLSN
jgi:hypothetical protein